MNELKKAMLKEKIKNTPKKTWVFLGLWVLTFIIIIAALLVAMHLSGYTLIEFISQFWAWFVLGILVIVIIVATVLFFKMRSK